MQKRQSLRNLSSMRKQIQDTRGGRLAVGIQPSVSVGYTKGLYLTQCMLVTDNYFIIKHRLHLKSLPSNSILWCTLEQNDKGEEIETSVTIQVLFIHNLYQQYFSILYHI